MTDNELLEDLDTDDIILAGLWEALELPPDDILPILAVSDPVISVEDKQKDTS